MATPHYKPDERVGSHLKPGVVTRQGQYVIIFSNFPVGRHEPQPEHKLEFADIVKRFKLGLPGATGTVSLVEGYTDAVDREGKNVPLRLARASAVSGWLNGLIQQIDPKYVSTEVVRGAPPGAYLNPRNDTEAGRADNRAVRLELRQRVPPPPPPPPPPRPTGPPDKGRRPIFRSYSWTPSGWHLPFGGFDIALYPELGDRTRGVIVVELVVQLQFEDGTSELPATKGQPLRWTEAEKKKFAADLVTAIKSVWADKHRITTTSSIPEIKDVGVIFEIKTLIDGTHTEDHFEFTVKKVDVQRTKPSSVTEGLGNADLDSFDLVPKPSGQRGGVHEFGHVIGLPDEYKAGSHWLGDTKSVMNDGEIVRDRHYAFFADWLTQRFAALSRDIKFKVNGTVDLSNARLR